MDNTFEVSLVYRNDKESNTLTVTVNGAKQELGNALDVELDEAANEYVLTFWNEDGTSKQERYQGGDPTDALTVPLGIEVTLAGYKSKPNAFPFVGLYIREKLVQLWTDAVIRHQTEDAEPATKAVQ